MAINVKMLLENTEKLQKIEKLKAEADKLTAELPEDLRALLNGQPDRPQPREQATGTRVRLSADQQAELSVLVQNALKGKKNGLKFKEIVAAVKPSFAANENHIRKILVEGKGKQYKMEGEKINALWFAK